MKFVWLCCLWGVLSAQQTQIGLESSVHYEWQKMIGHNLASDALLYKSYDDEIQSLLAWFNRISGRYENDEGVFAFNLEAAANTHLSERAFSTPLYILKEGTQSEERGLITQASLDISTPYLALSVGRNRFEAPWISGSIDGIIAHHANDLFTLRAFWFLNYYDFTPNYYLSAEALGDHQGFLGANVTLADQWPWLHLSASYYYLNDAFDVTDFESRITILELWALGFSSAFLRDRQTEVPPIDERLQRYVLSWYPAAEHALHVGGSITGEKGLRRMVQMGAQPFDLFYLGNQVHRPKAENRYLRYRYEGTSTWGEILAGQSRYEGKKWIKRQLVEADFSSEELDLTFGILLSRELSFELSWVRMFADPKELIEFDTTLVRASLMAVWP